MNKNQSLKQALQDAGLSVKQFAEISDTPTRTIYQWVKGDRRTPGIAFRFLELYLDQEINHPCLLGYEPLFSVIFGADKQSIVFCKESCGTLEDYKILLERLRLLTYDTEKLIESWGERS